MHTVQRGNGGWVILRERIGCLTVEVRFRHLRRFTRKADALMVAYWLNGGM